MHHRKTYMYIKFQQNRVSRSVKTVHTDLFAKNSKLQKFATTNNNFKKSIFLDMHHHETYMYINFQQNRGNRSVIIVHTNVFAKNSTNSKFSKSTFSDMHHRKTYMYINIQQNQVNRSVKTVHTILFAKKFKFHKFATCN